MGLNKIALLLLIASLLCSSCSNNEEEQPLSGYEGALTIHARCIDGKYDGEFNPLTYSVHIGDDISGLKIPDKKGVFDGHSVIAKGIFVSKKEKTKVKASQLKNFDGTFSDLYVVYYYIGATDEKYCINQHVDFDGEYINISGDKISITNGTISGKYGDILIETSSIEREHGFGYFCGNASLIVDGVTVNSNELSENLDKSLNYNLGYTYTGFDSEGTPILKVDLTITSIWFAFFYDLACEYYQDALNMLDFYFTGRNTLSIDYDL